MTELDTVAQDSAHGLVVLEISTDVLFVCLFFDHALWHVGSWFPYHGLNPSLLNWEHRVLTTGTRGKSKHEYFRMYFSQNVSIAEY